MDSKSKRKKINTQAVTEKKRKEIELSEALERLEKSQEIAKIGSWEYHFEDDSLSWSKEAYRIFGVSTSELMTYKKFLSFIHPEDQGYVNKKWKEALKTSNYDLEHRIVIDKGMKWVQEKADIKFDSQGKPKKAIGIIQDITEKKKTEKKSTEIQNKLEEKLEEMEKINKIMIDRELKMVELKTKIAQLEEQNKSLNK